MYLAHGALRMPEQRLVLSEPLVIAESRSRDGSMPCHRVFRAVGSVPGLTKEDIALRERTERNFLGFMRRIRQRRRKPYAHVL